MTTYELMVILPGDMTEREALAQLGVVKGYVSENGGTITEELVWGKRDLAYTIQKQDTGFYAIFHFTMEDTSGMPELKNELRLDQQVMRELIIKIPDAYSFSEFEEARKEAEKAKEEAMAKRKKPQARAKGGAKEAPKKEKAPAAKSAEKASSKKSSSDTVLDDPDLKL